MTPSLENKLALMINYLSEVRSQRMSTDTMAFNSYLDDPEVSEWLERYKKTGKIVNTRFTHMRPK